MAKAKEEKLKADDAYKVSTKQLIERLRCEWYAKTVCFNRQPKVTVMRREIKTASSSITVNNNL